MSELDEEYMLHTDYSWDNFKVLNSNNNKKDSTQRIAVFEHKSRQYVRVYESTSEEYYYRCIECHSKQQEVKAKLSIDGLMFKVFEPFSHICSPKRYLDVVMIAKEPINAIANERRQTVEPHPSSSSSEEVVSAAFIRKKQMTKKNTTKKKPTSESDKLVLFYFGLYLIII
uniref:Uncharacterized protein n=1 Tax=Panagrolaimus superbus TaxID=310955 RepID=A0A914Y982_9BILA